MLRKEEIPNYSEIAALASCLAMSTHPKSCGRNLLMQSSALDMQFVCFMALLELLGSLTVPLVFLCSHSLNASSGYVPIFGKQARDFSFYSANHNFLGQWNLQIRKEM
ncbi:hypothetical protein [Adlercreutzia sp. ZJ242]|uniref:hypothetical protein n=1 Tax=Adlercreutzia sp. ZJ242 TaxID=2709409 RepID=UPI0013EAEA15|nr:hypothetical protein [Adlercreutzia sp. ZJ242]